MFGVPVTQTIHPSSFMKASDAACVRETRRRTIRDPLEGIVREKLL